MKKTIAISMLFVGHIFSAQAQYFLLAGSSMLQVPEWERVVYDYNLATPWERTAVKPLQWGFHAGGGWSFLFLQKPQVYFTPQLRYSRWSSANGNIHLTLHQLCIGPELRFNPRALIFGVESAGPLGPRWYIGMQPGLQCWMPTVKKHNEWALDADEKRYRPITARFNFQMSTGYHAFTIGPCVITPEVSAQWIKGAKLDQWAENIHGHNIIGLQNEAPSGWAFAFSLIVTKINKSDNWWDRPRGS